jgi:flagellar basal-body rod modification protein FlgD
MAFAPVDFSTSNPSGATTTSANSLDTNASADRFLKLLVAQMQNQDPLNPMDNAQVTTQMAQINTVSGIEKLNGSVQSLSSQFMQMQALQGATLVGRDVVVPGDKLDIVSGVGQGGFELDAPADKVKVEILSSGGEVLDTINLDKQTSGMHGFNWDAGEATNTDRLRFRVTATTGDKTTQVTELMRDRVGAVSTSGSSMNLELLSAGSLPYSEVRAFN